MRGLQEIVAANKNPSAYYRSELSDAQRADCRESEPKKAKVKKRK